MTPGSTHVVRCPSCGQLGTYPSIASGNTFGAVYYTDGRRVAPMLPVTPSVVRCGGCSGVFWLESATEVGEYSPWGSDDESIDPTWTCAAGLVEPDEQQYLAALEQLVAAKMLRQLGEFNLATAVLSKPFPPEYDTALSRLLDFCAQRNSVLQKL